ncbi:hypothetical protein Acsp03_43630 [Actinomadura sp. NBRC 104412]|uniref:hypothetical protein n=1 Tax=Actinomadura sp. NBRC 104412 TaxID=3032203 RepID=UPI0024A00647|nr:hypothetical protein [Actinomadura sp. NBRC 104412]GLZ06897.1 hypothetical protein Acsp03_43630 [Actinomadura sp. NBRC 104412]
MIVGRTDPRLRHGPAGLFVALFLAAGLVFSYGLGHGPPLRVCTAHHTSVPAAVADAMAAHSADASAPAAQSFADPAGLPPTGPVDACLTLAVLLGMLALSLAAKPRRTGGRRPPRSGWAHAPPAPRALPGRPLSSLQVLRL